MESPEDVSNSFARIGQSAQRENAAPVQADHDAAAAFAGSGAGAGSEEAAAGSEQATGGLPTAAKAGVAAAVVLLLGIVGFVALSGGGDTEAANESSETTDAASDSNSDSLPAAESEPEPDDESEPETTPPTDTDPEPADPNPESPAPAEPADSTDPQAPEAPLLVWAEQPDLVAAVGPNSPQPPPGAPATHSMLTRDGKLYLRGYLPSAEVEALIVSTVDQVVGQGNAISEYVIDPNYQITGREAPAYIADTVLFAPNSATLDPEFYPLLGPGLAVLQTQPTVTIEIVGHTDSQGSAASNLTLSQQRTEAVRDFFLSQGADPERVIATGKGETEPRADNATAAGREANRRVEFIVNGFDFS